MVKSTKKAKQEMNSQPEQSATFDISFIISMLESSCRIQLSTALHFFRKAFANQSDLSNIALKEQFYGRIKNGVLNALRNQTLDIDSEVNAVWIITNMCCISQEVTHLFVNSNCLDILIKLVRSQNARLSSQTVWAIANIAADCSSCKLKCRSPKLLKILARNLQTSYKLDDADRRQLIWCVNNIFSGGRTTMPSPVARSLICALSAILLDTDAVDNMGCGSMILWTLANLVDNSLDTTRIDMLLSQNYVVEHILEKFIDQTDKSCNVSCLRLIGNIAVGNDVQTDLLVDNPKFRVVMNIAMSSPEHHSEAAWIISNVVAGAPRHVDYIMDDPDAFYEWVMAGIHTGDKRLRKECLWIIGNLLATADEHQTYLLVSLGIVQHFPALLDFDDVRLNEKAATTATELLREHPWQYTLFQRLDILGCIERAGANFSIQKAELKSLMNDLAPPERKDEDIAKGCSVICYSKLSDDFHSMSI
ncbi:Importin subunit alpha [Caenorhabditis elegans]|uniref:Importin subunit alpha n=1 Tax=Caenorhabditis elegans TaxID=6239 RepID=Q20703_CAEEL|nr:Importin subunit alpha [Caenorhabditis elegans]CAA98127.3 Importin subunit alpha [Caenorhabditis elegans]|eukprot:NP_502400.2 Uncharacterized protein CELE_F53B2.5 [Caenorhabditis elegans]